jgi:SH3 domain protein
MKRIIVIGFMILLMCTPARAEIVYVSEIIEITLRTGPGIDHKVIAMLKSGQVLEILESGQEWTHVQIPNGKEGYVLNRFLTVKKPNELLLEELRNNFHAIENKAETLREETKKHSDENRQLVTELAEKEEMLTKLTKSYESLRQDSTQFFSLKTNHKKSVAELSELRTRAVTYEEELTRIKSRQIYRWVLTGAGILLVGFLIGMSSKRQRRRSSLL